mgnify:CR=1 FL=1|jgi:hypothetical protein
MSSRMHTTGPLLLSPSYCSSCRFGKKSFDYSPGMLGYDLFGYDSPKLRDAEITNGRVAMIAITVFALEEAIFQAPVVRETAVFFQPIWTTLGF